jgi:two-component system response regulator AtoC
LRRASKEYPDTTIIMLTAQSDEEVALECLELGAFDYLKKPINLEEVDSVINHLIRGFEENEKAEETIEEGPDYLKGLIGGSDEVQLIRKQIQQIVSSRISTVLIQGDSGTGKEVIAKCIHEGSSEKGHFMSINCAALPENLLESEFFGHAKGAFTDAKEAKKGLFQLAGEGTILLDEVGELSLGLQSKLLRVIEDRTFMPVGGSAEIPLKARIIAATNRDMATAVREKHFRQDLFYRLNVIPVHIPPLRRRRRDIQALTRHFIKLLNKELSTTVTNVSTGALSLLCKYSWPGNARQLRNVLERIMVMNESTTIMVDHLPDDVRHPEKHPLGQGGDVPDGTIILPEDGIKLEDVEKELIRQALERTGNNVTRAGALLGLHRDTLRYRAKKHGLMAD